MKGRIIISLLLSTLSCTLAKAQIQEDLLCLNTTCFQKEESKTSSFTSPIEHFEQVNSNLPILIPERADTKSLEIEQYLSSPAYSQNNNTSRYFSIVNKQIPFFEKRFMNVRAYDLNYGTNPAFESSRPKIAINIFKQRNWDCARTDWNE